MVDMEWISSNRYPAAFPQSALAWIRPRRLLLVFDVLLAILGSTIAFALLGGRIPGETTSRASVLLFQTLLCFVTLLLLYRDGQYSSDRRMSRLSDVASLIKNTLLAFFFVCGVWLMTDGFFTGFREQSRLLLLVGMATMVGFLVLDRVALTHYQRRLFARGEGTRNVLVIGQGAAARDFLALLERHPWLGIRCGGTMSSAGRGFSVARVGDLLKSGSISEVVVALDPHERNEFDRISRALSQEGIYFRVVPALFEESLRVSRAHGVRGLSVFDVRLSPLDQVQHSLKRALDVVVSAMALLLLSPVFAVIALAVRLDSKGPVIFRQVRLGLGGRPFEILKFRTMVVDAEERLAALKQFDEGDGPHFKMKDDPRITRVGRFLRKWSLDELPQFVNVLRGEMSLVGPRPPLPREVDGYEVSALVRLRGKPGITGLWQVSGRKDLTFDDMVRLDRQYLESWSIGLDLAILARTVLVVLARKGAY